MCFFCCAGFAAKGVANLLDKQGKNLFNYSKEGKGLKHWLNDMTLKSHNEIASKGEKFAKKNMWKLNVAHVAGLAYSTLALGFFLPKLNIFITNMKNKKQNNENNVKIQLAGDKECLILGKYSTKEKALKAMELLREAYLKFAHATNNDSFYAFFDNPKVFRFPADDEVKV